ncbi:Serine/threonine-protein kinase PknD [uncultured archaeon]|nr:Serine/threonine-protein kinase PknD [uncultured archaeon]
MKQSASKITREDSSAVKPTRLDERKEYSPKTILLGIAKNGYLNATDPVGQAIKLKDRILGAGGQSVAYEAQLVYGQLGEDGWRLLYVPILTHQYVKQNSGNIAHWEQHRERALSEAKAMNKSALETRTREFLEQSDVIGKDRLVALRVSLDTKEDPRESRQRYITGLQHQNLAYLFANGETKDGRNYGIVELLQGSLNPEHTNLWPLEVQIEIAKQVVRGIKKLHDFGVLHRDIKPENIFHAAIEDPKNPYSRKTHVKLADYGLMKQIGIDSTVKTMDGTVLGTIVYMAPEQAHNSRNCTPKSDQFSAGASLFSIMTNNHPLGMQGDEDFMEVIRTAQDRQNKLITPLDEPNIRKEGMEMILAKMLQYNPASRYDSCKEILEDLERVEKGKFPVNTNDDYARRVFTPSNYSTAHKRRMRQLLTAGIVGTAVAAGCIATYLSGILDPLIARIQ